MSATPRRFDRFLGDLVADGDLSAVTACIREDERTVAAGSAGWRDAERRRPAGSGTVYDLASLTKVAVATLALVLHRRGELPLGTRIDELEPLAADPWEGRSLEDCLRHRAGLPAWAPLYALGGLPEAAIEPVLAGAFPAVEAPTYSDLGYVVWGRLAERATGLPLATLLARHVLEPLGMEASGPAPGPFEHVAACFLDGGREMELAAGLGIRVSPEEGPFHGVPQDGNARFLGGLAGHAGLFGTLDDLLRLVAEWLSPGTVLDEELVERALDGEDPYALGWWRPAAVPALAEVCPSGSFGMLGFTGGTLWIDPGRRRIVALLGHRIDSTRPATGWRREFVGMGMGPMGPAS